MKIPLLNRGRVQRASSADFPVRSKHLFRLQPKPKFRNPLPHPARVAVLRVKFSGNQLRVFQPSQGLAIQAYSPAVFAGSLAALRRVSAPVTVSKAVVVFTNATFPHINAADRDWLWQKFQVPCFEQMLDAVGNVIAEECQVHAGLHVIRTQDISGTLCSVECDCGRAEPRLLPLSLR